MIGWLLDPHEEYSSGHGSLKPLCRNQYNIQDTPLNKHLKGHDHYWSELFDDFMEVSIDGINVRNLIVSEIDVAMLPFVWC